MKTIGIIGGGNMGAAIIARTRKAYKILVCEADAKKAGALKSKYGVHSVSMSELARSSNVIVLAVKPQDFGPVLSTIRPFLKDQLVVSIAAGITTLYIEKKLGRCRVVRTMPNMPAQIGEGITAICRGRYASAADLKTTSQILNHVGKTVVVNEGSIDAVTAVSGSGPAYVFLFVECFLKAARSLGLNEKIAKELVLSTLLGSTHLLEKSGEDAGALRAKVTSKGGTTQAAMDVFLSRKIDTIFTQALKAAKQRAKALAKK